MANKEEDEGHDIFPNRKQNKEEQRGECKRGKEIDGESKRKEDGKHQLRIQTIQRI